MGMLNDINKIAQTLVGQQQREKTRSAPNINHPLAKKTSWGNNRKGGKYKDNFRLVIDSDLNQLKTDKVLGRLVLGGIFFTVGGFFIYAAIIDTGVNMDWPALIVGGLVASMGGIAILAFFQNWGSVTFDKTKGEWWFGTYSKENDTLSTTKEIGAVQVLNEWVVSSKVIDSHDGNSKRVDDSHSSFELNLVFNDGKRQTIQDSRYLNLVESNADEIGIYLDVPVWK